MREIKSYKTLGGAQRSLDNGGRFYNVFARSGDDIVDPSELARAAGLHSVGMKAFLHFEMGTLDLTPGQKDEIVTRLSPICLKSIRHRVLLFSTRHQLNLMGKLVRRLSFLGTQSLLKTKLNSRGTSLWLFRSSP